jgi:hypothetical protein
LTLERPEGPFRRRGDREQEVVELISSEPVQDERKKKQESPEVKRLILGFPAAHFF